MAEPDKQPEAAVMLVGLDRWLPFSVAVGAEIAPCTACGVRLLPGAGPAGLEGVPDKQQMVAREGEGPGKLAHTLVLQQFSPRPSTG